MTGDCDAEAFAEPPLAPLTAIPPDIRCLADYERRAKAHISPATWCHIQSGSGEGRSLAANRTQFQQHQFVPAMLRDLRGGSTQIELFGRRYASPMLLAPVAYHRLVHPDGEVATISAATALDMTMVVSTLASRTLEEIAAAARDASESLGRSAVPPLWFQLYIQPDRAVTLELVRRAEAAGYTVLMVTVDAAVKRSEFALPQGVEAANLRASPPSVHNASALDGPIVFGTTLLAAAPTWEDIAWLRTQTKLPIVVKGLLCPQDAKRAVNHGVDGIVASNHGGRVLDNLVSPLAALPAMLDATGGRVPVLLDSGVRSGSDVVQALALGASAVLIGRPQLHALAVAGMPGVAHLLHILRAELELTMAQLGCPTIDAVGMHVLTASR